MTCSKCGAAVQPGAQFCTACGQAVGAAPAPAPSMGSSAHPPFSMAWLQEPMKFGAVSAPRVLVLIVAAIVLVIGLTAIVQGIGEIREGMGGKPSSGYQAPSKP